MHDFLDCWVLVGIFGYIDALCVPGRKEMARSASMTG